MSPVNTIIRPQPGFLDRDTESPTTVLDADASRPSLQRRLRDKAMHLPRLAGSKQLDGSSLKTDPRVSRSSHGLTATSRVRAFLIDVHFTEKAVPVWNYETRPLSSKHYDITYLPQPAAAVCRVHCAGMCDCFSADTAPGWHRWLCVANLLSCSFPFHSCLIIVVHKMFTAANAAHKPPLDTRVVASSHHWHRHVTSALKTKAFWCQRWSSTAVIRRLHSSNVYSGPSPLSIKLVPTSVCGCLVWKPALVNSIWFRWNSLRDAVWSHTCAHISCFIK